MSDNLNLKLVLKAFDGMSGVVKSACRQSGQEFEKMNKKLEMTAGKFNDIGKKLAGFGGAVTAAAGINLKFAGDFEQGMNNISTLIDTNKENLQLMGKEVLNIAKGSPKVLNDLTEGLYSIRSAGISASDAMKVLKGSEMLAVAGLSTIGEASGIAAAAINAFKLKGEEQNKIYDMFNKVVAHGITNISEFSQGFGQVAGVVSGAGIKLDEYSASVAALTTQGEKASIAHTQLKAAIAGLTRGSKEQLAIFNKYGAKSFADLVTKSGGMVNAFDKIYKAVGRNDSKLIQLVGSVEAYSSMVTLLGAANSAYNETLTDMRYGGDVLTQAYNKQLSGLNSQMGVLKNNFQSLSIQFGNGLLPVVKLAAGGIKNVASAIGALPDGLKSFISISTAAIGVTALLGGTGLMAIGGMINGFVQLRTGIRAAMPIIQSFNLAMLANPAVLITAGVIALGTAVVYCYNKFEGFRNMCQGLWAVIKAGGAWLGVLGQSFISGAVGVWNFIKPAVKFYGAIKKWATPLGWTITLIQKLCGWIGKLIDKAGGWRGIGENAKTFWTNSAMDAAALNKSIKAERTAKLAQGNQKGQLQINGSHAQGLNYVPFNGYIAELHKGERIQTRKEADLFRQGTFSTVNSTNPTDITVEYKPVINIQGAMSEKAQEDFMKLLKNHKDEIVRLVSSTLARQEVRSY